MKRSSMLMALGLGLALAACGGGDDVMGGDGDGDATDRCTSTASLCVDLFVPEDYAGTPRQIIAGFFESLPPQGPPLVVAALVEDPVIGVDASFELTATDLTDPGDYFLYIVLYNEGGGEFVPEAGIDYTVETSSKLRFGEDAVNMPDMMFQLAE